MWIMYTKGIFGWTWDFCGFDDGVPRVVDLTNYKTKKALFAALDSFESYREMPRIRKT